MQDSAPSRTKKHLFLAAIGAATIIGLFLGWIYTSAAPVLGYASCKRMPYADELDIQPRRLYAGSDVGGMGMFKYKIVFPSPPGYAQKGAEVHPNVATPAFDGWLLGGNRGEFGGELMYQVGYEGAIHKLLDENVEDMYKMPFGFVVTTGMAHMDTTVVHCTWSHAMAKNCLKQARSLIFPLLQILLGFFAPGMFSSTQVPGLSFSPRTVNCTQSGAFLVQRVAPNNSFKPTPLRGAASRRGLTQALGSL